jgi:TonB-linked SusC/RagA family outer membrane protein
MNNNYLKYNTRHLKVLLVFVITLFVNISVNAQNGQVVTGTVTAIEDGSALPGVSILVKGTTTGVSTDFDGNYSIEVPANAVLVFSFVGETTQEIAVNGRSVINVVMKASAEALDEVVVTALGIKREEKSLGYAVEEVKAEELTRVVHENVLNSMSGKVAGVTINSTGGAGSSVSMVIRGATSLSTDNQPLFVVDGVPMSNTVNNVGGFGDDNKVDYGNAISDLDPESIENVTILKGPSAAALYGTRAGNGVVLITTKRAKDGERTKVAITSNTVFDIPSKYLDVQNQFSSGFFSFRPEDIGGGVLPDIDPGAGTGAGPENDRGYWAVQWNAPLDENGVPIPTEVVSYEDNVKNFLNPYAFTSTNGVALTSSSDAANYRLGYTNMTHSGLIPNSDLHKNSYALAASSKLWDKVTVSTDINFNHSWADNRPASNRGANPLQWAYSNPTNIDIRQLQDYGSGNNILRVSNNHENPYFLAYDVNNSFSRFRLYGNLMATWEVSDNFSIMGRYTLNKYDDTRESKIAPGYLNEPNNGAYGIVVGEGLERNMDILATYKKDWDNFNLSISGGANAMYQRSASISNSSKPGSGLVVPNLFTVDNINSGSLQYYNRRYEKSINSVYGMANFGWKDIAYVDLTARNDWSSTLPAENRSYFYPSASLSLLVNNMFNMGNSVNLFKLRAGWAQVGNDTGPYRLNATYGNSGQWGDATMLSKPGGLLAPNLLPEQATSLEFGIDLKLFHNRLRFEGTYYTVDNENQILGVPLAASSGFGSVQINAGLLQSTGYELLLGVTPVRNDNWNWDLNFNFTQNETKMISLAEGVDFIEFWDAAKTKSIGFVKGYVNNEKDGPEDGLVGNLYSRKVMRVEDESSPYFGYPILGSGLDAEWQGEEEFSKVGNYNPDFIMGLQSALSFKNFTLAMTFDWRSGGQYVSQTYHYMTENVSTQTWLDELVHPGDLGGGASQALRDWVIENEDQLLLGDNLRPVGGPTPDYGGFPESFSGVTVYDGTFAPGVMGHYDDNGKFILEQENLGGDGTVFLPYVVSNPWDIGSVKMFDADYIKLREIALSYKLSNKTSEKIGLQDVNFSIYSRNIMLWTKESGFGVDPERAFQAESSGGFSQGVERYNVNPWVVPVGFKIGFTF